jgi:uncharacterized protein (DUF2236 family)
MEHAIARLINGERLVVLGWGRAILMQLAHPLVAAGVAEHSTFRASTLAPVKRLHATVRAMLDLTFGDERGASAAAARINAIHDRVRGRLHEPAGTWSVGTPYSAHDPALLFWVHATLLDSLPLAYETFVGSLEPATIDRYVVEAADGAARLGLEGSEVPRSRAEVSGYLDRMLASDEVAVTATARELAHEVLNPTGAWLLGPIGAAPRLFALGTVPPAIRDLYGFEWSADDARRFVRLSALLRRWRGRVPGSIARFRAGPGRAS